MRPQWSYLGTLYCLDAVCLVLLGMRLGEAPPMEQHHVIGCVVAAVILVLMHAKTSFHDDDDYFNK